MWQKTALMAYLKVGKALMIPSSFYQTFSGSPSQVLDCSLKPLVVDAIMRSGIMLLALALIPPV
jgi:hypothetical protein